MRPRRGSPPRIVAVLLTILAIALVLPGAAVAGRSAPAAGATARPNIVLILADDLDLLLGSLDAMPHARALLADGGMTFANAFVPLSLCCPSRASLLRGQYPHNHQIYTNSPPDGGFQKARAIGLENDTIATRLQGGGYRTVLLGKYLNGYPGGDPTYIPPGWSEWYSPTTNSGYNQFDYDLNENGVIVPYGGAPQDYLTDVMAAKADDFIRRTAPTGQPFFIKFSTFSPHTPATPAPRHADLFPGAQAPRTPSFNEADISDKPQVNQREPLSAADIADIDALYRKRLQSLQAIDEMIAGLVATLGAVGQLDNTYIVFTADNGYHLGQHRLRAGKYTAYEEDIRVPLLVRGPGVPAGATRHELVSNVDLAPTFAALAGLAVPPGADGRALTPLLYGIAPPAAPWRTAALFEQYPPRSDPPGDPGEGAQVEPPDLAELAAAAPAPAYVGLRTAGFKYVEYPTGEREFYDLVGDPHELQNLAATADPALLGEFAAWLGTLHACAGAGCRAAEERTPPGPAYLLTVAATGPGGVTGGTPAGISHPRGTTVTLDPQPAGGAIFARWLVDGAPAGWADPLTIRMDAAHAVTAEFVAAPAFCDLEPGAAGYEAILNLAARGIIRGYAEGCGAGDPRLAFGAADPTARAQMAALITRGIGYVSTAPWDQEDWGNPFTDQGPVDADLWRNVGTLAHYGVARGYPDADCLAAGLTPPCYGPTDPVLRVQTIAFIGRAMVARGYWTPATVDDPAIYPNVPAESGHRLDLATWVNNAGDVPGRPRAEPWADWDQPATRAAFAEAEWQALDGFFRRDRTP